MVEINKHEEVKIIEEREHTKSDPIYEMSVIRSKLIWLMEFLQTEIDYKASKVRIRPIKPISMGECYLSRLKSK